MDQQAFGAFVMDISKPQRCWVHVEQVGDELVLRWRAKWFAAAGSFAFLLLFTAFCVFVIAHATRAPTLGDILFWIFLIGMNIPGACYSLWRFLGTERLRIGLDGLDYQSRALIPLQERHVPLGEIKGIDYSLKIETLGKPVRFWFWQDIEPRERRWLADLLQKHLQALMPDRVITLRPDLEAVTKLTVPIEVLGPAGATPEPPSDCAIRLYTDWDRVEFVRRRAFSLLSYGFTSLYLILYYGINSIGNILGILLLGWCMFGLFGLLLEHKHSWFLLLFLGSLSVIGFFWILRGYCLLLTIPFWVERWAMIPGEITAWFSIFLGLGRPQRIEAKSVGRVELRKNARIRKGLASHQEQEGVTHPRYDGATVVHRWLASHQEQEGDTPYSLGLVGWEGQDLLIIAALTAEHYPHLFRSFTSC